MKKAVYVLFFFFFTLASLVPLRAQAPKVTATDVIAEFRRLAAQPLWPGFDPLGIPALIYDGERTVYFDGGFPPSIRQRRLASNGMGSCGSFRGGIRRSRTTP